MKLRQLPIFLLLIKLAINMILKSLLKTPNVVVRKILRADIINKKATEELLAIIIQNEN